MIQCFPIHQSVFPLLGFRRTVPSALLLAAWNRFRDAVSPHGRSTRPISSQDRRQRDTHPIHAYPARRVLAGLPDAATDDCWVFPLTAARDGGMMVGRCAS